MGYIGSLKFGYYYLQTVPCALGSTQPLKMSTRIFLWVKTAWG